MTVRPIRSLAARSALAGLAAGTLAAIAGGGMLASAQSIAGFNSDAPVNYAANRIELQDKQKRVILSGNVDINQGDLRIRAARTTVAYIDNGGVKIQRIDATGGVIVTRGSEAARGDVAIYDFNRRVITMVGNVALLRGSDNLKGGRLVIDLASGVSSVDGRGAGSSSAVGQPVGSTTGGGRVSGSFTVPKRD
ncbi:MAG: OstA family protein [Alphaproteobacteria bacterium]|nr:OstA family protein [Alphaproteobacteria bacterium]